MISKREFQILLTGVLLTAGVIFVFIGLIYKVDPVLVLQSVTMPPVFGVPNEVNRDYVIDIIDGTNIERKKANLAPLKENSALSYAAYLRARDILKFQDFSHEATQSGDRTAFLAMQVVGYRYIYGGENLAMGTSDPNEIISDWLASPKHKDNLLNRNFKETGVAVLNGTFQNQEKINIIVQLFGSN